MKPKVLLILKYGTKKIWRGKKYDFFGNTWSDEGERAESCQLNASVNVVCI